MPMFTEEVTSTKVRVISSFCFIEFNKKQAKELKASRPKEMFFEEDWDYMKLTLKY